MNGPVDEIEDSSTDTAFRDDDDVVMEEADGLSHPDSYRDIHDKDNMLDLNTKNGSNGYTQEEHRFSRRLRSKSRSERDSRSQPPVKSRLFPIEVVLKPPPNPSEYQWIEPSETAERIVDELEVDGEVFYSLEFDDGHIEQVGHDLSSSSLTSSLSICECHSSLTTTHVLPSESGQILPVSSLLPVIPSRSNKPRASIL
ncbi:hypothetical protein M434DRAFT_232498 [Hypoxylon sp. CO27-5]|nr:hypothetical protein M434DRAFT_232498 [Hypoxylon sp. CO27-5]